MLRMSRLRRGTLIGSALATLVLLFPAAASAAAVVTDGKFTNVYVFSRASPGETWDEHVATLRPDFTRANIDAFTEQLMSPDWPTYFDALVQYSGIHPPEFFGSSEASQECVDAALKDAKNKVLQIATVRSLANCHADGRDPSPQVNLIFSPDIVLANLSASSDMCALSASKGSTAYHAGGLNVPNYTVLPTSKGCVPTFDDFTDNLAHEVVELLTDPAGAGIGGGRPSPNEVVDRCIDPNNPMKEETRWAGHNVPRYWSDSDQNCQPRLEPLPASKSQTWRLGDGWPLKSFTSKDHDLTLKVPANRTTAKAPATSVYLVIQTGDDDLRGGKGRNDNADVTLNLADGSSLTTTNINQFRTWNNGETHAVTLALPYLPSVESITGVTIHTQFDGGPFGDQWKINKVSLVVCYVVTAKENIPPTPTVETWLDKSDGPLVRFTGTLHDSSIGVQRPLPPLGVVRPACAYSN
jgi:hypothetical protein